MLRTFEDVDLAAFADPDIARASRLAQASGARAYETHREMLAAETLDAVYICVPPFAHGEPDGPLYLFDTDGAPREMSDFSQGVEDGIHREWTRGDTTGHYYLDARMRNGLSSGEWKWYFQDGHLHRAGVFIDGAPHGRWRRWDARGHLIEDQEFDHGTLMRTIMVRKRPY